MNSPKTTISMIGVGLCSLLTTLALIPHDTGLQFIPEPWRSRLIVIGAVSALVMRVINGVFQKQVDDEKPNP